jgi:hypothetical protein
MTIHITGIRKDPDSNHNIVMGVIGRNRYTLDEYRSWGYYHFEVGQDYEVVKTSDKSIKVKVLDKKGKDSTQALEVVKIEEVE